MPATLPAVTGTIQPSDSPGFIETYDTRNVGTGKTLTASGVVNDGHGGANYTYSYVANNSGVITNLSIATDQQPTNLTVCAGSPAIFTTTVPGVGLTYQWQLSLDYGVTYNNILDATNASYTNLSATLTDGGNFYQVIVSGDGACR